VADGVLPALLVVAVVGKALHDELIDAVEGDPSFRRVLDGHGNERNVGVGRFDHVLVGEVRRVGRGCVSIPGVLVVRVASSAHGRHASVAVVGVLVSEQGVHGAK